MKELITTLFGEYTPVTFVDPASAEEVVASGLAGVDWPWVAGVVLFALVLWSFFRILGVMVRG